MRGFGIALIVIGVIWVLVALNLDTSVATDGTYGPDRVENIGLIAQRQSHLFIGGLVTLIGVLLTLFGARSTNTGALGQSAIALSSAPRLSEGTARDLREDAYKIWLIAQYKIEKNDVLGSYVCDERLFATVDEALKYAHAMDTHKQEQLSADIEDEFAASLIKRKNFEEDLEINDVRWRKIKPYALTAIFLFVIIMTYNAITKYMNEIKADTASVSLPLPDASEAAGAAYDASDVAYAAAAAASAAASDPAARPSAAADVGTQKSVAGAKP